MLQAHLTDAAIAAAKAWSHEFAGPPHLAYAIARHFRDRSEFADLLPRAREALGPHGSALGVPMLSDDAAALVRGIDSPDDALSTLREVLSGTGGGDSKDGNIPGASPQPSGARAGPKVGTGGPATALDVGEAPAVVVREGVAGESVADVLADLEQLVGLENVKRQVHTVIAVVQANQERKRADLPVVNPGLHLVFTGAPGTGKTTVARLMARLYAASGALPGSKFVEVDRSGLVAGFVGQTAQKTAEVIQSAIPGVLFIDEAYALTPHFGSDYGAEAIATLVKAMEDHRGELSAIVAGYREEMTDFIQSNPGLRSRFKTFVDFPDYEPTELLEIFSSFVNAAGLRMTDDTLVKAEGLFEEAVGFTDFGNARYARSLFEQAYARMAVRAAADGEMELSELTELAADDLQWNPPAIERENRRIGFGDATDESGGSSP